MQFEAAARRGLELYVCVFDRLVQHIIYKPSFFVLTIHATVLFPMFVAAESAYRFSCLRYNSASCGPK